MSTEQAIEAKAKELGYNYIQQVAVQITSYRVWGFSREVVVAYDSAGRILDATCYGTHGEKESTVERWMIHKARMVEEMLVWAAQP